MPHVQTKCLGQTAERLEEQREERDWLFVLFVFEREREK